MKFKLQNLIAYSFKIFKLKISVKFYPIQPNKYFPIRMKLNYNLR